MDAATIKQIHDDLVELTDHINQTYVAAITKDRDFADEPKLFLYTVLFKLNNGLSSCRVFLNTDNLWQRHLDGLFLILRTMMSDSLICQYVIRKDYDGNDASIVKNIRPLYTEHFKFTLRDIGKYYKKIYDYTDEQVAAATENLKKMNSDYFNRDGSFKYKPEVSTMGSKVAYLICDINEDVVKLLIGKAYNLYMHFSKYEHLGILSLPMIWRQYDEKNHVTIFRQIVEAIIVVGHSIELCLRIWDQYDVAADPVMQSAIRKFDQHRNALLDIELGKSEE
jgi:hypothetical protein